MKTKYLKPIIIFVFIVQAYGINAKNQNKAEKSSAVIANNVLSNSSVWDNVTLSSASGDKSLLIDTMSSSAEWNEPFILRNIFKSNSRYRISFDYRILEHGCEDFPFCLLMRSKKDEAGTMDWENLIIKRHYFWSGKKGKVGSMEISVYTENNENFSFIIGIHWKGKIVIDNFKIMKLPLLTPLCASNSIKTVKRESVPYEPIGMCQHGSCLWRYPNVTNAIHTLDLMKTAGVQWVRIGAAWPYTMPNKGIINTDYIQRNEFIVKEVLKRKMKPYIQLGACPRWASTEPSNEFYWAYAPRDMEEWRKQVAFWGKKYKGTIKYWEVYNEPDWIFWRSNPEKYFEFLKVMSTELKKIDPKNKILLGGLATDGVHSFLSGGNFSDQNFLQRLYDANAGKYFDIMSLHVYERTLEDWLENVNTCYGIMKRNGDGNKRIWITEMGLPTFAEFTEKDQADYLELVYTKFLMHPKIDKVFWYNFRQKGNDPKDREHGFGIVTHDKLKPRKAYNSLKKISKPKVRKIIKKCEN